MNGGHDLCAFTHGSCHAFDGFCTHVTYGKYPAPRRLQWMAIRPGINARQDETLRVESDARSAEPVRIRLGAAPITVRFIAAVTKERCGKTLE